MMTSLKMMLMLAAAGAIGTLARFGISGIIQKTVGGEFPWGTLAVNGAGCFLAGAIWAFLESRIGAAAGMRMVVLTGFMGAFTTFSAFMIDTGNLALSAGWATAAVNIILQNGIGVAAVFAGLAAGRAV